MTSPAPPRLDPDEICAVVLAAGKGTRLRPLTSWVPKALCPVGNIPLLERALSRLMRLGLSGPSAVAVNACHLGQQVVDQVGNRAHLSVEQGEPLGTSGGVGNLRDWIDRRGVLVGNVDGYLAHPRLLPGPDIARLLVGWDGRSVRLLGQRATDPSERGTFSGYRFAGFSLLPWDRVCRLTSNPGNLVHTVWRPAEAAEALEVVPFDGTYLDCGTPVDYLAANLHAAGGSNLIAPGAIVAGRCTRAVVGAGAVVEGEVTDAVVWPAGRVLPNERLTRAIRAGSDVTVAAA